MAKTALNKRTILICNELIVKWNGNWVSKLGKWKGYRWVSFTFGRTFIVHTFLVTLFLHWHANTIPFLVMAKESNDPLPLPKWNIFWNITKYINKSLHAEDIEEKLKLEKNNNSNNFRNKSFNARVLITFCLLPLSTHRQNLIRTGYLLRIGCECLHTDKCFHFYHRLMNQLWENFHVPHVFNIFFFSGVRRHRPKLSFRALQLLFEGNFLTCFYIYCLITC